MIAILILMLIIVILYILWIFYRYFAFFENNYTYSLSLFFNREYKYRYIKLNKIKISKKIKFILKYKNSFYSNKPINDNFNFLIQLAAFIDKEVLKNNLLYRSKNKRILVDEISKYIVIKTLVNQKPVLFKLLKECIRIFKINKKELNILKVLLSKYLFLILIKNYLYTIKANRTIQNLIKSKNYSKSKFNYIESYSILKYNKNTSMFKGEILNPTSFINRICRTYNVNRLAILYLKALYN